MSDKEISFTVRPQGYFVLSTDQRGKLAEFPNLILNTGLDLLAVGTYLSRCYVGSGTVAPTVNDTQMGSLIAETGTTFNSVTGCATSAPYYSFARYNYRFAAGAAMGNLSEVGIGNSYAGKYTLLSRALIKDSFGNPTTITLLPDEILEVTYELRHYIPDNDVTGSITFTGNLAGTYAYTMRAAKVTQYVSSGYHNGWSAEDSFNRKFSNGAFASSKAIGGLTEEPSGVSYLSSSVTGPDYVNGSYSTSIKYTWDITEGNVPGGIRSISFSLGIGKYQIQFDPPIPKTNMDTLSLTFSNSWARKP